MRLRWRAITRRSIKPTRELETDIWLPTSSLSRATMARNLGINRSRNDFLGSSSGGEGDSVLGKSWLACDRSLIFKRAHSRRAPDLARGVDDEPQLCDFVFNGHGVAADAAGEAALRRKRKLLNRGITARLFDSALELVL